MAVNIGLDFTLPYSYVKATLTLSLLTVWVLVGLFQYLNRYTQRNYFSTWTAAWLFYAIFLTLNITLQSTPPNAFLVMWKNWSVGTSAIFLLWGSFRFLKFRAPQSFVIGLVLLLSVWSYYAARQGETGLWVQAPAFLLLGAGSGVTAYAYMQVRRKRNMVGAGLLSFGFSLWGLYLTCYPFLELSKQLISMAFFISAMLQLFIAVSMIVLVLEEVRATAEFNRKRLLTAKTRQKILHSRVRSSEDRYRKLFEQASEAIVIASADDLKILEMNDAARLLLAASNLNQSDITLSRFCLVGQGGQNSAQEWFTWLTQQRQVQVIRSTGSTVQAEVTGSPIWFAGRKAYQFFFRELTERGRLEQQLRHVEKLSAIGQMISGISHELNNPLTSIKGYLELILARHELPGQTRVDLQRVAEESNRAANIVQNFLTFSREQSNEFRAVEVKQLIESAVDLRKFEMRASGVELDLDFAHELPSVRANADQIKQVLVNLINNSLYAVDDQPEKRVRISVRFSDLLVQIRVQDNGPGIPEAHRSKIFEPFFTTKPVGKGTGLGLSIAHTILKEHEGRIFYEPATIGGAGFVLELPAAHPELNFQPASTPAQQNESPMNFTTTNPARILILDDEITIAEMLGEMLELLGYSAVKCNAPRDALDLITRETFDIILSDYRMPHMNGQQFYKAAITKRPSLARRIIFLTGDVVTRETQEFLASTGNPHLAKPFQLVRVEKLISEVLEREAVAAEAA